MPESGHAILLFWITRVVRKEWLLQTLSFGSVRGLEASSGVAGDLAVCEWSPLRCMVDGARIGGGCVVVRRT